MTDFLARLTAATLALALVSGTALSQTESTAESTAEEGSGDAEAGTEASAEAPAEPDIDPGAAVATVNGTALTLGELIALRSDLPEQYQQLPDEVLLQGLTEQLVDQTLMAQAAREAGLAESQRVKLSLKNQERAVLADVWFRQALEERVTPEAIQKAYDDTYANADPIEEVKAAHILVETEEKAKDLKKQLDEGAEFAQLARDHGTDGTATRGGDLGWFAKADMVPSFGEAAFAMEPGSVSDPVQSPFGWHLIRLDERRERPAPPMEEVQTALAQQVMESAREAIMAELREKATVEMPETPPPPAAVRADDLIDSE